VQIFSLILSIAVNVAFIAAFALPLAADQVVENKVVISLISKPSNFSEKQSLERQEKVKISKRLSEFSKKKLAKETVLDQDSIYIPPQFKYGSIDNPIPRYPTIAVRNRQEGKVVLCVDVDVAGNPANVNICSSSGYAVLDSVAIRTVKKWRFSAGRQGGKLVEAQIRVPIVFSLS